MTVGRWRAARIDTARMVMLMGGIAALAVGLTVSAGRGAVADSIGARPAEAPVLFGLTGDSKQPERGAESQAPSELAREGLAKMLQALNTLIQSVPQYEMPTITEDGDIIMRRKEPGRRPAQPELGSPGGAENRAI